MTLSFKDPLRRPPGPFREGDRVGLLWGFTPVEGVIIEDRGNVGVGGRRFYRVRVQPDDNISPPLDITAPVEDLTLVAKAPLKTSCARTCSPPQESRPEEGEQGMPFFFKDPLRRPPGPFREGDRVRLLWGFTPVEGVIVEDRGDVSRRGRRFYRVRCQLDDNISPPMDISAPAADLTLVAKAPRPPSRRRKKEQR